LDENNDMLLKEVPNPHLNN